ncbi:MAG: NifB/NifX family molybdenum-iron cluster-binding protein [Wolinella sp.]
MRVAIPLRDDSLHIFANAGHAPFFGIFELKGAGMFKKFDLIELRSNPRANLAAEKGCSHTHSDNESTEEKEAHKREHDVLAELAHDCKVVLVQRACKNTALVMNENGIVIKKIPSDITNATDALKFAL